VFGLLIDPDASPKELILLVNAGLAQLEEGIEL
jgi:hypothetical protein